MSGKSVIFPSNFEMREAYRATGGKVPSNLRTIWTPMAQAVVSGLAFAVVAFWAFAAWAAVEWVL